MGHLCFALSGHPPRTPVRFGWDGRTSISRLTCTVYTKGCAAEPGRARCAGVTTADLRTVEIYKYVTIVQPPNRTPTKRFASIRLAPSFSPCRPSRLVCTCRSWRYRAPSRTCRQLPATRRYLPSASPAHAARHRCGVAVRVAAVHNPEGQCRRACTAHVARLRRGA